MLDHPIRPPHLPDQSSHRSIVSPSPIPSRSQPTFTDCKLIPTVASALIHTVSIDRSTTLQENVIMKSRSQGLFSSPKMLHYPLALFGSVAIVQLPIVLTTQTPEIDLVPTPTPNSRSRFRSRVRSGSAHVSDADGTFVPSDRPFDPSIHSFLHSSSRSSSDSHDSLHVFLLGFKRRLHRWLFRRLIGCSAD